MTLHVYRRNWERFSDACVREVGRWGQASTIILAGISFRGKTELVFLYNGAGRGGRQRARGWFQAHHFPGRVAQSVTCLATDACLTSDPGVASSIPARSHTFVEIDHVIISTAILLLSAETFKKGYRQLQSKICARSTG